MIYDVSDAVKLGQIKILLPTELESAFTERMIIKSIIKKYNESENTNLNISCDNIQLRFLKIANVVDKETYVKFASKLLETENDITIPDYFTYSDYRNILSRLKNRLCQKGIPSKIDYLNKTISKII